MSIIEKNKGQPPTLPEPARTRSQKGSGRLPWVVFGIGAFFFVAFSLDTLMHGKLWVWDRILAGFLKSHWKDPWNPVALWAAAAVTQLGDVGWLAFFALLESLFFFRVKRPREIWVLVIALLGSAVLVPIMKELFAQPRPIVTSYFTLTSGYNFPSGHTTGATVFLFITAYLWGRRLNPFARRILFSLAAIASLAVGASLIYIGAHYMTDVLAAWAFCAMWVSICALLSRRIAPILK